MKRIFKRTLAVFLATIMVLGAAPFAGVVGLKLPVISSWFGTIAEAAATYTEGYYTYIVDEYGNASIIDVDTNISGDITIPYQLGGYPVTSIGSWAFEGCKSITSIRILDIVTSIGHSPFRNCDNLERIIVDNNNINYSSDEYGVLFDKNKKNLIEYPAGNKRTQYEIPDTVTTIMFEAFFNCKKLSVIINKDSIDVMEAYSFYGCEGLQSFDLPESLVHIGEYAFCDCYQLQDIEFPTALERISRSAFYDCDSITTVELPRSLNSYGISAFGSCDSLERITVDYANETFSCDENGILYGNVDNYGAYLLQCPAACQSKKIIINDNVKQIAEGAFDNCAHLEEIEIGKNLTFIPINEFSTCKSLKRITVSSDNEKFSSDQYGALYDKEKTTLLRYSPCSELTDYVMPEVLEIVESFAFHGCTNLTSIYIGEKFASISVVSFLNICENLKTIKVNADNQYLSCDDNGVLFNKSKTELLSYPSGNPNKIYIIPEGVTSIESTAFYKCNNLETISIPSTVKVIPSYVLDVYVYITLPYSVFYTCENLTSIEVDSGNTSFHSVENKMLISHDENSSLLWVSPVIDTLTFNSQSEVDAVFTYMAILDRIKHICIGQEVNEFDAAMFTVFPNLVDIIVDSNNNYYSTDENGVLFNKDKTELLFYPNGKTEDCYSVPSGVKTIQAGAFYGLKAYYTMDADGVQVQIEVDKDLKSVILSETVETINEAAFIISADYIHVPSSVTSIGENAFLNESNAVELGTDVEIDVFPYICSDTEDCYAKEYADANGIEFVLCNGHEEHTHHYTSSVTKAPTCKENGIITYTCECKHSYTETIPSLGHTAGDWETVTEPTTTSEGEKVKKCTVCGEILDREIIPVVEKYTVTFLVNGEVFDVQSYSEGEDIKYPATPMKAGYVFKGWMDENGDEFIPGKMPAKDLVYNAVFEVCAFRVTFDSNGGYFYSEDESEPIVIDVIYGESFRDLMPPDPIREGYIFLGYTDRNGNNVSIPETMPSYDLYLCAKWDAIECKHSAVTTTVSGTCTTPSMQFDICELCGKEMSEPIVIPAPGHSAGEWEIIVEATCTAEGKKIKKCTACSEILETEAIDKLKHIPGEWVIETEATTETEGKKVKRCTVCNTILEEEIIPRIEITVVVDDETGVELGYIKDSYDGNVEISVEETFDGTAINIVNTENSAIKSFVYDIKMILEGEEIQPEGKVIIKIPLPEGYNPSRTFVYYVNTETKTAEKMPAVHKDGYMVFETTHFSYYALVEEYGGTAAIRTPSTTTIKYGDGIVLHADLSEALPAGWTIKWSASNGNFDYSVSADGTTCTITPSKSGDTTFTATVYDAEGKEVSKDEQTMTSKAGFFQKLAAFFKKLFGLTKTYPEAFKDTY